MSFFSPVNQARWARFRHNRRGYWSLWLFLILFLCSLAPSCSPTIARCWCSTGPAVRPGVEKLHRANLRRRVRNRRRLSGSRGCSSSWRLTAGRYGRQFASARRQLILPARFPFHRRPQPATGSAPTPTAAMCWRGFSMGTRISVLFGLLLTLFSSVLGCWRGDTGLLRR